MGPFRGDDETRLGPQRDGTFHLRGIPTHHRYPSPEPVGDLDGGRSHSPAGPDDRDGFTRPKLAYGP